MFLLINIIILRHGTYIFLHFNIWVQIFLSPILQELLVAFWTETIVHDWLTSRYFSQLFFHCHVRKDFKDWIMSLYIYQPDLQLLLWLLSTMSMHVYCVEENPSWASSIPSLDTYSLIIWLLAYVSSFPSWTLKWKESRGGTKIIIFLVVITVITNLLPIVEGEL